MSPQDPNRTSRPTPTPLTSRHQLASHSLNTQFGRSHQRKTVFFHHPASTPSRPHFTGNTLRDVAFLPVSDTNT